MNKLDDSLIFEDVVHLFPNITRREHTFDTLFFDGRHKYSPPQVRYMQEDVVYTFFLCCYFELGLGQAGVKYLLNIIIKVTGMIRVLKHVTPIFL